MAAASDDPLLLVLDDMHELQDEASLHQLELFLRYAPQTLRVMMAARADPRLPLQRFRVTDALAEVRSATLAFTREETAELFADVSPQLGDPEIDLLYARTEGWPAALRFAALAVDAAEDPRRFVGAFAGDDRAVADYLLTEVLASKPPQLRDFLLRTATPDRLTVELAAKLTGVAEASKILEALERENLFVTELAAGPRSYRYHQLFLDFLRTEARRELVPDEAAALHGISASWYARQGDHLAALRHSVAGCNWEQAAELVLDNWRTLFLVESVATVAAVVARIPSDALERHPELALLAAVSLFDQGEVDEGERCVAAAGDAFAHHDERQADLESFLTMCRAAAALRRGEPNAAAAHASKLIALPPTTMLARSDLRRQQTTLALATLGEAELDLGLFTDAEEHLEQSVELARSAGAETPTLRSLSNLALIDACRGRLRRAAERGVEALGFADVRGLAAAPHTAAAHLAVGWARYHWDELEDAALHAASALRCARAIGDTTNFAVATTMSALVDGTAGPHGADAGIRRLRGLAAELPGWEPPPILDRILISTTPRLLAGRGDIDAAGQALDAAEADDAPPIAALRARLHLLQGRPWEALETLTPVIQEPVEPAHRGSTIECRLLESIARAQLRDPDTSRRALESALELAVSDAYRRVFVDAGPTAKQLLLEHVRGGTAYRSFVAELLAAFGRRAPRIELTRPQLLEPLSPRELAVLGYLPTMMSNAEIASEMFVSVNTVKTHLRSIYRKLGASRRRDAVAAGRSLEII
jgi:LuxR family maltose regulon positive regulatory protein